MYCRTGLSNAVSQQVAMHMHFLTLVMALWLQGFRLGASACPALHQGRIKHAYEFSIALKFLRCSARCHQPREGSQSPLNSLERHAKPRARRCTLDDPHGKAW